MSSDNSLSHTRWNCKYHTVLIPKYRMEIGPNCLIISFRITILEVCLMINNIPNKMRELF